MEGWVQRLFVTLVLAVVVLLIAFGALAVGLGWPQVTILALVLFAAMVAIQLVVEMRRDVRMLKNQALELSGYESEIGRRVDYLASLVERSGGAAPDELARRVRAVHHQYGELIQRVERMEEDVAEIALRPNREEPVAPSVRETPAQTEAPEPKDRPAASVIPMPRPRDRTKVADPPTKAAPAEKPSAKVAASRLAAPVSRTLPRAEPPSRDAAREWREKLAGERLAFHLQAAVALPARTPVYYEAQMRLREADGTWLDAEPLRAAVAEHGLASLVERKTLYTAARMLRSVRRMGKDMRLVAPLSVGSLADERGFDELRKFLEAAPDLRDALTLEIAQSDFRGLSSEARQRIGLVADAGFTLALGNLSDTATDPKTLNQLGFTLVRAPASLVVAEARGENAASLAVSLAAHRIDLTATQVAPHQLVALVDRDVSTAQGTTLSAPRLVKPELLEATAASAPERTAAAS